MTHIFSTNPDIPYKSVSSQYLYSLHKSGFKLVPLLNNHIPAVEEWTPIYENPCYWKVEDFEDPKICSSFKNVATTLGKTRLKDSDNSDLYIQVLDVDSEKVFNLINTPILQLCDDPRLESDINDFLDSLNFTIKEIMNLTLLDIFKKITFVTKTKKPYGYHIWWLSHKQNNSILTSHCKENFEFEIKADKKGTLCTLPPSTHREDKNFRYTAIGKTDELLISDSLYSFFITLFGDCMLQKQERIDYGNKNIKKSINEIPTTSFYDLTPDTIKTSAEILSTYYKQPNRNNFTLPFGGYAYHCKVSEDSVGKIISKICELKEDKDLKERLTTLHATYQKASSGQPITGGPTLADLIARVEGCDISCANNIVDTLKKLWYKDFSNTQSLQGNEITNINNGQNGNNKQHTIPEEISVAQAKRRHSDFVKVKGTIIGMSPVYNMIKSVDIFCHLCEYKGRIDFPKPVFKSPVKEKTKCPLCEEKDDGHGNTATATFNYVSVIDIELQDLETFSEIERLSVKVFDKNTLDVTAGELVSIIGNLHVIRKNDNPNNKLETVLFADSLEYIKRQELVLTEKDIQNIKDWTLKLQSQGKNPIDELVNLFAPELIDRDHVKKGMLMVCANAGVRNVDNRLPKRLRINALLIGEPGIAKTTVLEKTIKLVPNSQYTGGQSSTGLSLTSQVSKEDGGIYTLRFGPVVLAKDSVCAINELGQLPLQEHKHLLDCMEENGFPMAKYGFSIYVEAHPSIIASANPINNKWLNGEVVNFAEFPTLPQIVDRSDLIFILRENKDPSYLRQYAEKKKKISENYKAGLYEGNDEFIRKHILYTRTLKVEVSDQAYSLLTDFFVNMGKAGVSGLPRKLDSLVRITIAITKLKLKEVAEVEEAQEAIAFYNEGLKYFNLAAETVKNPRDITYQEIKQVLKEHNGLPLSLTEAASVACDRNELVGYYLLGRKEGGYNSNSNHCNNNGSHKESKYDDKLKLRNNYRLTEVLALIRNDGSFQIVGEKPISLRWNSERKEDGENVLSNRQYSLHSKKDNRDDVIGGNDDDRKSRETNQERLEIGDKLISSSSPEPFAVCDGCDVCVENKTCNTKEISETNNTLTSLDLLQKQKQGEKITDKLSSSSNLGKSTTTTNTHYCHNKDNNTNKETETIDHQERKARDDVNNNTEIENESGNSFSHTSHPSHSIDENIDDPKQPQNISNTESTKDKEFEQTNPQIQLKHSPNADIFTNDDINQEKAKMLEKSQDKDNNDNSFESSSK